MLLRAGIGKINARPAHMSQTANADDLRRSWAERGASIGAVVGLDRAEAFVILE